MNKNHIYSSQGRKWVEHNLREFTLQNQLKILLDDSQLVEEYYEGFNLLLSALLFKYKIKFVVFALV